jgi:hypothetical protein
MPGLPRSYSLLAKVEFEHDSDLPACKGWRERLRHASRKAQVRVKENIKLDGYPPTYQKRDRIFKPSARDPEEMEGIRETQLLR